MGSLCAKRDENIHFQTRLKRLVYRLLGWYIQVFQTRLKKSIVFFTKETCSRGYKNTKRLLDNPGDLWFEQKNIFFFLTKGAISLQRIPK